MTITGSIVDWAIVTMPYWLHQLVPLNNKCEIFGNDKVRSQINS